MAVVEHIDAPISLLGETSGELTFRVCRGGRAQQIVRVASQKCLVGSAADCTLRLHDAGIQPCHFVILRGKQHTIVRRLAGEALLNNRPFEDAPLVSGDWLTLGDLQVQVLTPDASAAGRKTGSAWDEPEAGPSALRPHEAAEMTALQKRLHLANGQGRDRVRRLVVRLRKLQRRLSDLEFRRQQQATEARELEERLETWNADRVQLDARRAEFEREEHTFLNSRAVWQADCMVHEQHLAAREAALSSRGDQFRHEAAELAAERAALLAQHDQYHVDHQLRTATVDEQEKTLAARSLELETAHQQHAQSRLQWDSERSEAQARLAQQQAEIAGRLREVESQREALAAREQQLRATADKLQAAEQRLDEERTRWKTESSAEQARLDAATREMSEKLSALEARWREAADLTRELTARQAAVDADRQQLRDTQAAWTADRAGGESDAQQQLRQLADQQVAIAHEREAAQRRSAEIDQQRDALQQEATELESLRAVFSAERDRWEAERSAALDRLAKRTEEVDRLSQELDDRARQSTAAAPTSVVEHQAVVHQDIEAAQAAGVTELAARTAEFERDRKAFAEAQAAWEAERATLERAAGEKSHASSEEAASLAARKNELEELQQALAEKGKQLEESRLAWQTEQAREQERLQAEQTTLTAGSEALATEQAAFSAEQRQARSELAALEAQHAEQTVDIERLQHELTVERQSFRDRREQIEQKLQERSEELETGWAELHTRQAEFETWQKDQEAEMTQRREACAAPADEQDEARQPAHETAAHEPAPREAPQPEEPRSAGRNTQLSSLALLTKMGLAVPDDDEPAPAPKPQPQPVAKTAPIVPTPGGVTAAAEEDDIDAYMARLLDRVGGRSKPNEPGAASAPRTAPAPQEPVVAPEPEAAAASEMPAETQRPERSLAPRALPPELSADLTAMRAVANANARSAIKTHMHRTVAKDRVKRLWACAAMLVVCGVLIWRHLAGMPLMLEAAAVIGLLTVLMGTKQLHAMRKFRRVQAELDAVRDSAGPAPAQQAGEDRSTPAAENEATDAPESVEADPSTAGTAAS